MAIDPLRQARLQKQQQIAAQFRNALGRGISITDPTSTSTPPATITLAAGEADQAKFAQGVTLLAAAETLAADVNAFRDSMVSTVFNRPVVDAAGGAHDMTVASTGNSRSPMLRPLGRCKTRS